jgi:hypothetical protein
VGACTCRSTPNSNHSTTPPRLTMPPRAKPTRPEPAPISILGRTSPLATPRDAQPAPAAQEATFPSFGKPRKQNGGSIGKRVCEPTSPTTCHDDETTCFPCCRALVRGHTNSPPSPAPLPSSKCTQPAKKRGVFSGLPCAPHRPSEFLNSRLGCAYMSYHRSCGRKRGPCVATRRAALFSCVQH